MPLIDLTFLFDVWFQEFKIKVKTGVFFSHVLVVDSNFFLNENFDLLQALQSIFRQEKFVGREERRNFFVEYYPLHTAEYATDFYLSDWLYSLWRGIKGNTQHERTAQ